MSIKLNYSKKTISKLSSNIVLFSDEKYSTNSLKKYISNTEFSYINDLLKTCDLKKDQRQSQNSFSQSQTSFQDTKIHISILTNFSTLNNVSKN